MKNIDIDDDAFKGIEAIIHSMTPEERSKPSILNASRKRRSCKRFRDFSPRSKSIAKAIQHKRVR